MLPSSQCIDGWCCECHHMYGHRLVFKFRMLEMEVIAGTTLNSSTYKDKFIMLKIREFLVLSCLLILVACSDSATTEPNANTSETAGATTNDNATAGGNTTNSPTDENPETPAGENADSMTDAGSEPPADENTDTQNVVMQAAATSASYRITFNSSWSAQTHATQFPTNAHFSGLVGAVHNDQVVFWEAGQIASDGIEFMAETGGKSLFLDEINSAIASGYAQSAIDGAGIASTPGSVSVEVSVTLDNPKVTLTTMLAPSPDWFTGFHDVSLHDGESFVESITLDGFVYDSGTDSGPQYTSADSDTQPREVIRRLTSDSSDSPFVDGLPVAGQFIIERL